MKKILWLCFALVWLTGMLTCFGVIRFSHAEHAIIERNLGSDSEIESVLQEYGFNLAWYEEPTFTDYIASNFK